MSISGIIQNVTGQLRQYDPEEFSEEMQDILEDIDKKIQEEKTKIDSIGTKKKYRNLPKADKEHLIKKHNLKIEDLEEQKKNLLFEPHEKDFFHMETLSFDERKDRNIETDPDVSKEMRRRHGVSEARRMRQQLAKERAEAKKAAGEVTAETPKKGIANIIKADGKWGELSNLSKHSFTWDGKEYNSVEHAYQTNKSGKFDRVTYQAYVDRPEALKIVGKFKADYDTNIQLMEDLYRQMLNENPDMVKLLQETEGLEIQHQLKKSDIWTKEMPKILTKLRDEFKGGTPEVKSRIVPKGTPDSVLAMRGGPLGNPFGYWGGTGELYTVTGKNETEKIAKVVELHKNWLETGEVPDDVTPENKTKLAALREEQLKTIDNLPDDYKLGYYRPDAPVSHAITLENFIEERRKGGTPEVKGGTVYNTIDNPQRQNHYVNRTKYNYANSDITFDFTTGEASGAGHSAGKGTPDAYKKWNNVLVDDAGKLTATNIDEVAQKLADALTSGQTVNIAGHGNYKTTRQGLPAPVWQSQIDTSMQTIFDRAKELAGDKPITGKVISGGQSGFDEAGIRVARNLGIPTEVNVSNYTWRDAKGEHYNDEVGFRERIDADSYDSETYEGKSNYTKVKGPDLKDLPGTLSFIDDSPPELKADLGLMYKMPPALVDGVAKVGAKVWNQALKAAPLVDEEILIQAPAKLVQQGLKGLGLGAAAGAVGTGATALGTYELFWMLINLGKAALNQAMGEAAEPGGVPPMLFSEHIELGENSEFDNAEQFMKDYETWAKGSVAVQAFRGVTGHDDPIEWAMSGFKKGDTKVNFFGYDWMKNVFSEASR